MQVGGPYYSGLACPGAKSTVLIVSSLEDSVVFLGQVNLREAHGKDDDGAGDVEPGEEPAPELASAVPGAGPHTRDAGGLGFLSYKLCL